MSVAMIVLRALCIFFGGTFVLHWLATNARPGGLVDERVIPPYWTWLKDVGSLDSAAAEALGNTVVLTAAGAVLGMVIAFAVSGLLSIKRVGQAFGVLSAPMMALAIPGIALYPLFYLITDRGLAPPGPLSFDESIAETLRFVTLWGFGIGLAIAPGLAFLFSGERGRKRFGVNIAGAWLSSRSEAAASWRTGLPSTALILAVAAAELLSGQPGLFHQFEAAIATGQLAAALDLAVLVIAGGAAISIAVDLATLAQPPGQPPEHTVRTRRSGSIRPLAAALTLVTAVAAIGYVESAGWLGENGIGSSVASQTAEALGPTLLAGLIPAAFALFFGSLVALLRHLVPRALDRVIGSLVDLLWWPTPMVLPLAYLHYGIPDRSEFHPGIIVFTGLAITPMTARLLGPIVSGWTLSRPSGRIERILATFLFSAALATSIRILVGYMGMTGADDQPLADLGAMMRSGIPEYPTNVWSTVGPLAAAAGALALLYWTASALAAPDLAPVPTAVTVPIAVGPRSPQELRSVSRATDTIVLQGVAGQPLINLQNASEPAPQVQLPSPVDFQAGDAEQAGTLASFASADEVAQKPFDPSQTIELRPSTLRRAGIRAQEQPTRPVVLSERPAPAGRSSSQDRSQAEDNDDP